MQYRATSRTALYRVTIPYPLADKLWKTSELVMGRASGGNAGVKEGFCFDKDSIEIRRCEK